MKELKINLRCIFIIFAAVLFCGITAYQSITIFTETDIAFASPADVPTGNWTDEGNYDIDWYNTEDKVFTLNNPTELAGFAYILSNWGNYEEDFYEKTIRLGADTDMSAHNWVRFTFSGVFDGGGHTVSGIRLANAAFNYGVGFISRLYGGTVKNLNITDSYFEGSMDVGAVVGYNQSGRIINCSARANVKGDIYVGGIVGSTYQELPACIHNNYFIGELNVLGNYAPTSGGIAGAADFSETFYNNYAKAFNIASGNYLDIVGNNYFDCEFENNYAWEGEGFRADFDTEIYTSPTELLASLNAWVKDCAEENDDYETYYSWKIEEGKNDGYPIFGGLYEKTYAVEHFLTNLTAAEGTWGEGKAIHISEYRTTLTAADGYNLPESVLVEVEGNPLSTDGFTYNSSIGELIIYADFVTGDISLTAAGVPKANTFYKVEHSKQNLASDGYETVTNDNQNLVGTTDTDTAASAKSYEGFTAQTVEQQKIAGDGSTVVHILYTRNSYTLVWETSGGTLSGEYTAGSVKYEADITAPANPSRDGYIFDGWNEAVVEEMPAENLIYTALWTAEVYMVDYDLEGGTNHSDNPDTYTVESGAIVLQPPVRTGYLFDGFAEGNAIPTGSVGNKTFAAKWILKSPAIIDTVGHSGTYDGAYYSVTVTASHDLGSVTYQWYKGSVLPENIIEGQTDSAITVRNISDSGTYYCRVTYTDGTQIKYVDSSAIEVFIAEKDNEGLPIGAIIGIVVGCIAMLFILLILLFFLFKRTVFFFVDDNEWMRRKFGFNRTIVVPEELRGLVWFKDKEMTQPFTDKKMKFKNIYLYSGAGNGSRLK